MEDYFTKETEILKKKQVEILELKYLINKVKQCLRKLWNRTDHNEDRISKLKGKNIEIILRKKEK